MSAVGLVNSFTCKTKENLVNGNISTLFLKLAISHSREPGIMYPYCAIIQLFVTKYLNIFCLNYWNKMEKNDVKIVCHFVL